MSVKSTTFIGVEHPKPSDAHCDPQELILIRFFSNVCSTGQRACTCVPFCARVDAQSVL